MADGKITLATPADINLEQMLLGGILLRPEVFPSVQIDARELYSPKNQHVFGAMQRVAGRGAPIDVGTLEAELSRMDKLEAVGGPGYLGELALRVPTAENTLEYAKLVREAWIGREVRLAISEVEYEAEHRGARGPELVHMLRAATARFDAFDASPKVTWHRAPDLVDAIWSRKDEPWASLRLGPDELVSVRGGSLVVILGGPGSGKSSLAANLLLQHARDNGPAIVASIELPADEFAARVAGIRADASWAEVLQGKVPLEHLTDRLALPRLYVLERKHATLDNLAACIDAARTEYPGEPVLCAVDYAQLIGSRQSDARQRVTDVFERLDELARAKHVVLVALSQMGRAGAKAAREGDRIGADAADLGAESAAIERFATTTLTIGKPGELREDGSRTVEVSLGKFRMGEPDKVIPAVSWGRSGRWAVAGEKQESERVREKRAIDKESAEMKKLEAAIYGNVSRSSQPMTRNDAKATVPGKGARKTIAIDSLIARGDLVELARKAPKTKYPLIWTLERARAAQIPLAADVPGGSS